jgi:HSP20 family molecular chaperone IbpA
MAAATKKQPAQRAVPTGGDPAAVVDPKFEWVEKAGSYVLRVSLPGLRKEDFRVQVDGAGRLTVRGSRPAAAGKSSLHKVFQLPSAASFDNIAGRFEAGVLSLTMAKRASSAGADANADVAAAPTSIEEIKRKQQPGVAKEEDATGGEKKGDACAEKSEAKEEITKEDALKEAMDEATNKAQEKAEREKKAAAACGGWKERVAVELKVLTDMKWADGLVETARNNKEVVAVGVAAFSLGFLVSHRLFRK